MDSVSVYLVNDKEVTQYMKKKRHRRRILLTVRRRIC